MANAKHGKAGTLLVPVAALASRIGETGLVVVDCRFDLASPGAGLAAYRASRVPGARYADLDRDLSSAPTPATGRHPLPSPAALARTFSSWGIGPGTEVVAYDAGGGSIAARLWWLLRWMGHRQVGLLDGGFGAWQRAGLPIESGPGARISAASFGGEPGHMPLVDSAAIARDLPAGRLRLLDARAPERFSGAREPIDPVAGHVPGAVNAPFQDCLAADGRFLPLPQLRERVDRWLAGRPASAVAWMCGSGVTACHGIFTLELAGHPGASLYAGSWSEWIRDPARPVGRE